MGKKFVNAATAAEMISEYTGIELSKLVDVMKEVPNEDVVPVVRCKDCIFQGFADEYDRCYCERSGEEIQPNDFCSYGERINDND